MPSAYPYFNIARHFGISHARVYEFLENVKAKADAEFWLEEKENHQISYAVAKAYLDEQERRARVCQT